MDELTQAWLEEEALHGDEELIVVTRCDWAGHEECGGTIYKLIGSNLTSCHQHIVLHDLWCAVPMLGKDFVDWLDGLENDTARIMYEANRENVSLNYWREV